MLSNCFELKLFEYYISQAFFFNNTYSFSQPETFFVGIHLVHLLKKVQSVQIPRFFEPS